MGTEFFSRSHTEVFTVPPVKTKSGVIKAGISTRQGGVSSKPYATLNFGYHVGDNPDDVSHNRRTLGRILEIPPEQWIAGEQVHGNKIAIVTDEDTGKGALDYDSALSGIDGLLTADKDCLLTACFADCVPLLFWSTEHPAVGIAHAGWKGTVSEIAANMVRHFQDHFGITPEEISTAIGPSIGPCCYEVDNRVAEQVKSIPRIDFEQVLEPKDNDHFMLNLQLLNKLILLKSGVLEDHIFTTTLCTSCHTDLFFSHRKEGGPTGRMISYIGIFSGD